MTRKHSAVRTIKNGTVTIDGKTYTPRRMHNGAPAYDGRLDGLRYLFGRYPDYGKPDGYEPFISIVVPYDQRGVEHPDMPHIFDGYVNWQFWYVLESNENYPESAAYRASAERITD